ncbi:MAG TPA: HAD hydrolase-like protein [Solirubrobacteraceae bacterium]|jgi:beta-phosphoglucomutase-like phosphatase (HAD superfamily)|nr:HAD hydrolase-like protein [Solirubrobacteraceae bacterium]
MGELELVIFDCDGVLVDSEVISNDVLARALTAEGLPTTLAQARREYQGMLLSEVVARAQQSLGRELADSWVRRFERDRAEAFRRELEAVPGAASTVQRVKDAGVLVCVASQGSLQKTRMTLGLTGLRSLFPAHALFLGRAGAARKAPPGPVPARRRDDGSRAWRLRRG